MHWWWHEFDEHNAYTAFAAVAAFMHRLPLRERYWHSVSLNVNHPPPSPAPTTCNSSAPHENSHFPLDQGHVLAGIPHVPSTTVCQHTCCADDRCSGWVYATSQPAPTAECAQGDRCCWIKSGVVTVAPMANCTAGLVTRPRTGAYVGAALVGQQPRGWRHNTAAASSDVVALWVRAAWSTWHTGGGGNSSAQPDNPVNSDVRVAMPASLAPGSYTVTAINTTTGEPAATGILQVSSHADSPATPPPYVDLPPFIRDIAVVVVRQPDVE